MCDGTDTIDEYPPQVFSNSIGQKDIRLSGEGAEPQHDLGKQHETEYMTEIGTR